MRELRIYDGSVRACGVGRAWEVVGNEVETNTWPDVKHLLCSVRSLDWVLRALGSTEDFKQGSGGFAVCIFKRFLWQQ